MLTAKKINKCFGSNHALRNVNVNLSPGTITTLIGPSGSGKSTTLRALAMLEPPDSGEITLNGTTYNFPLKKHRPVPTPWPIITIVFQQLFLWPHLTLRQNIVLPVRRRGEQANGHVADLVEKLEMGSFVDRYPNEVSLGQRQLAAITRALALKPKYLLLDEITSALDVEYVGLILDHLRAARDEGLAILLVTHFIGFARESASQVLFMDHGAIVESGGPETLDHPKTERLKTFLSLVISAR